MIYDKLSSSEEHCSFFRIKILCGTKILVQAHALDVMANIKK